MLFESKILTVGVGAAFIGVIVAAMASVMLDDPTSEAVTDQRSTPAAMGPGVIVNPLRSNAKETGDGFVRHDIASLETHMRDKFEELQTQIERLGREYARRVTELNSHTGGAEPIEPPYSEDLPPTAEEEMQRGKERLREQVEGLNLALESEVIDSDWKPEAQKALYETFESEGMVGLDLLEVDCRTTLCRFNVTSDGSDRARESLQKMTMSLPWNGAGFITQEGEQIVVYLTREGELLPETEILR